MKPIVLAMVVADNYYRDSHTGKSIISGTFNSIKSAKFPAKHGTVGLYLALTDIALDGEVQISFRHIEGSFDLNLPGWQVKAPDSRHSVVEIGGNISGLPMPEPGMFEFVVHWDNHEIFSRRIAVEQLELPESENRDTQERE